MKRRTFLGDLGALTFLYPATAFKPARHEMKISAGLNVVCVGGHPDDPESGCGGTLAIHSRRGNKVTVIYLTSGEAGIPGTSHQEASEIRKKEAIAATAITGAVPLFFGQVDGASVFDSAAINKMHGLLRGLKPDIVYTHWPIDSHPDHQVASLLTYQAWLRMDKSFEIFYFEVNSGFQTMNFVPTDYVDISEVADIKKKALYMHTSQAPEGIYNEHHHVMQLFRGREIGVKEAEAFSKLDAKASSR